MRRTKKSLAFLLAFMMVLTLIPASAFAATKNSVDRVVTVATDSDVPDVTMTFKVDGSDFTSTSQSIKLSLKNAEWQNPSSGAAIVTTDSALFTNTGANILVGIKSAGASSISAVSAVSVSDTTAELTLVTGAAPLVDGDSIVLTLKIHAKDENGEVKVNFDPLDSNFSAGNGDYVVAIAGSGKTSGTTVGDTNSTWRAANFKGNVIEIRENSVNSIDTTDVQSMKLTLPNGMNWNSGSMVAAAFSGNFGAVTNVVKNGRDLTFDVTPVINNGVRQLLTITPYIDVTKDAKMGDITVSVKNETASGLKKIISNVSGLVIGKYVEENVTIKTVKDADLPEFIVGRTDSDYEVEITVEESIDSALSAGRFIDFEFPDYVQIVSGSGVEVEATGTNSGTQTAPTGIGHNDGWDSAVGKIKEDTSSFEYTLPDNLKSSTKDKYKFTIPVTVSANTPAGDLKVKVSGAKAGVSDTELVVAKLISPISAEVKLSDLRAGVQNQVLGDIVIKENAAGYIMDDKVNGRNRELVLTIADLKGSVTDATVEVVNGDMELGKIDTDKNSDGEPRIIIPIKNGTTTGTPGEIKISKATVTLDRTPAEGKYKLKIGGNAVVENGAYNDGDFAGSVISTDYVNVITPADSNVYGESKFVIGQKTYNVLINGEQIENTMDVAPYVDTNSRTMIPMRYVANALGISDNNIVWNQAAQTATFFKGDRVCVIKAGDINMTVNGAVVPMDTVAVVRDNRIYVPMRYVANALGASVDWDQATLTVTINASTKTAE